MTGDRRNRVQPTFALLSSPPLRSSPLRPPRSVLLPSLPPLRDRECPCCTDTVAIRAEQTWRPDWRERPALTHPGPANGVSEWISEHLGRYYGYQSPWGKKDLGTEEEEIRGRSISGLCWFNAAAILLTVSVFFFFFLNNPHSPASVILYRRNISPCFFKLGFLSRFKCAFVFEVTLGDFFLV